MMLLEVEVVLFLSLISLEVEDVFLLLSKMLLLEVEDGFFLDLSS